MKIFLLMTFYYQLSCVITKSRSTSSARYTFPSRVRSTPDDKMRHLSDMHRLVSDLMTHYDPSVVPTSDKNGVVNIKHLLILNSIVQLDSKGQKLSVSVSEVWQWEDFYLSWDPSLYNNITETSLMRPLVWIPDLVILNQVYVGSSQSNNIKANIIPANVNYKGEVRLETPSVVDTICEIDIGEFPFDTQECDIVFGSWSQGVNKVSLQSLMDQIDLSHYVEDAEWTLMSTNVESVNESLQMESIRFRFSRLNYRMTLRRRMAFYSWNIVVPAILVNTMSVLVFLLPPENGEKVSLGVTILLALSVNMMVIRDYVPANSLQTPVLSAYTLVCMIATTLTLILSLPVVHVKSMGTKLQTPPSDKLLSICTRLSWWFCMNKSGDLKFRQMKAVIKRHKLFLDELLHSFGGSKQKSYLNEDILSPEFSEVQHGRKLSLICNKACYQIGIDSSNCPLLSETETNFYTNPLFSNGHLCSQLQDKEQTFDQSQQSASSVNTISCFYKSIAQNLETVLKTVTISRQRLKLLKLNANLIYLKWISVVMVFDRCLALIYAAINIGYLIYFAPYYLSRSERWF